MSQPFAYLTGNPDNLTGGSPANMTDIQGPFTDLEEYLNHNVASLPTMILGRVNGDGTIAAGTGFSVVHSTPGIYDVTIPNFTIASLVVTPAETAAQRVSTFLQGNKGTVTLYDAGGATTDCAFSFLAARP